jgi:hypothetical protein
MPVDFVRHEGGRFGLIPYALPRDFSPQACRLYCMFAVSAHADLASWPSLDILGTLIGQSRSTTERCVRELSEGGLVRSDADGVLNGYTLLTSPLTQGPAFG